MSDRQRQSILASMSEMVKESPKELDTALLVAAKNPRGIPEVVFIVSVSFEPDRGLSESTGTSLHPCIRCPLLPLL